MNQMWPPEGIPLPAVQVAEPRVVLPPASERWGDIGFWLAQRNQIEDLRWWGDRLSNSRYERGICAIISCVGVETRLFEVPRRVTNSIRKPFFLPVNWKAGRKEKLDEITQVALEVLNQGQSVLIHCN